MIYQQLRQRSLRVLRAPLARPALLEISPLLAVLIALWLKLAYFTCLISSELWLAEEPRPWGQLALYVLSCLVQHPHIVTATLATLLVLFAPFWMLSRTWRFVSVLLLDFVLTILGLVDLVHVRFYADVVAVSDLALAPALGGVLPSILKGLQWTDALYGCDIIIGCALLPGYANSCKRIPAFDRVDRGRIAIALAVFGLILGAPTALTVWRNKGELFSYVSLRIEAASTLGILPYHVVDALINFAPAKAQVDAAARERLHRFLNNHYSQTPSVSPIFGIARGRNVIVISAESLQAFPIGLVIDGQPISPRLSAFATESLEFVNFYDQTHLGTTSDAEFMAMQSLHPLPARVVVNDLHYHYFRGLPKILSEHGYATLSLCAATRSADGQSTAHAENERSSPTMPRFACWPTTPFLHERVPVFRNVRAYGPPTLPACTVGHGDCERAWSPDADQNPADGTTQCLEDQSDRDEPKDDPVGVGITHAAHHFGKEKRDVEPDRESQQGKQHVTPGDPITIGRA